MVSGSLFIFAPKVIRNAISIVGRIANNSAFVVEPVSFGALFGNELFECQVPFGRSLIPWYTVEFFLSHAWYAPFFKTDHNVLVFEGLSQLYLTDYTARLI